MKKLSMCCFVFLLMISVLKAQKTEVGISGRVFTNYSRYAKLGSAKSYVKYMSDFKVILIRLNYSTEIAHIAANKIRICANDPEFLKKYNAKIVYTDKDGNYLFRGLKREVTYLIIFCDRKIQISQIVTGKNYTTYNLEDKAVQL